MKAVVQFALAGGIEGDFEKAYSDIPRKPDGSKVALKPFAARAGKLAEMLSQLVAKLLAAKTATSEAVST